MWKTRLIERLVNLAMLGIYVVAGVGSAIFLAYVGYETAYHTLAVLAVPFGVAVFVMGAVVECVHVKKDKSYSCG